MDEAEPTGRIPPGACRRCTCLQGEADGELSPGALEPVMVSPVRVERLLAALRPGTGLRETGTALRRRPFPPQLGVAPAGSGDR